MPDLETVWNGGWVTARDRSRLAKGECQNLTGVYYRPGDREFLYKIGGRSQFGDTQQSSSKVKGLALCTFDSGGNDKLVAFVDTDLYTRDPASTGTLSAASLSLDAGLSKMSSAHANDRWYFGFGGDQRSQVLQSDGTFRAMGMKAPQEAPTLAATAAGVTDVNPDANSGSFTNPTNAYVQDDAYAHLTLATPGTSTGTLTYPANTSAGRSFFIKWALAGAQKLNDDTDVNYDQQDTGASPQTPWNVTVKIEVDKNDGGGFVTIKNSTFTQAQAAQVLQEPISDTPSPPDTDDMSVKFTLTYNSGSGSASLRVYYAPIQDAPSATQTLTAALKYAFTEYLEGEDIESATSEVAEMSVATFGTAAGVTITLPTKVNSNATHFRIYRTGEGGTSSQLGYIAEIGASETTFIDTFETATTTQPAPLIAGITVGSLRFSRDAEPPALRRIRPYQGSLVGLSDTNKRALYYSMPVPKQESWPEVYVYTSFPLDEHDELLDCIEVGGSLVIAAQAVMIRLDGLARAVQGQFLQSNAEAIAGAPGCVGDYALAQIEMNGQQMAAWISPFSGVFVTNGHSFQRVSDDFDWETYRDFDKTGWALHWDEDRRVLIMDYSSTNGGENDRYALIHFDAAHRKENGQPKWTGPHYAAATVRASGQVSNAYKQFSAHNSNGKVYLENDSTTGADASNAYDSSGTNPLIVESGYRYSGRLNYHIWEGELYHGDFGSGQSCTLTHTLGRDSSGASYSKAQSVSLADQKATQFGVHRAGRWSVVKIEHTGTGLGSIGPITEKIRAQGESGERGAA